MRFPNGPNPTASAPGAQSRTSACHPLALPVATRRLPILFACTCLRAHTACIPRRTLYTTHLQRVHTHLGVLWAWTLRWRGGQSSGEKVIRQMGGREQEGASTVSVGGVDIAEEGPKGSDPRTWASMSIVGHGVSRRCRRGPSLPTHPPSRHALLALHHPTTAQGTMHLPPIPWY